MKTIRMIRKDVDRIVQEIMKGDEPCVCDNLEVLDALLKHERDFIILNEKGTPFTKEYMKKLREQIDFDPRGRD